MNLLKCERARVNRVRTHVGIIGSPVPHHLSTGELVELCRGLSDVGIDQAIFNMPNVTDITPLETIGREVIPEIADL